MSLSSRITDPMNLLDDLTAVSLPELQGVKHWQQQYRLLTDWGRLIRRKAAIRRAEYLIKGCELPVWLCHWHTEGRHYLVFDSDSRVMNGLAALILSQLNGCRAEDLAVIDLEQRLRDLGLDKHLTPSRNNGVRAILQRCLDYIQGRAFPLGDEH